MVRSSLLVLAILQFEEINYILKVNPSKNKTDRLV